MSKDLDILRLKDDLEQSGKEITHLQSIIDNLISDQSSHNNTLSRMSIENNALQIERDDLKDVIQLADDGIADINSHWKQKFFNWRETEIQLINELTESKNKLDELTGDYELKIEKQSSENKKLNCLLDCCKNENQKLVVSLQKSEDELKIMSDKLMLESRNNIQHMFLSRENDILIEKVKILESKVQSFYDESIRRETNDALLSHEAERDLNNSAMTQNNYQNTDVKKLKTDLHFKENEINNLKDELNRMSCHNESQNSRLMQLRKQAAESNDLIAESTNNLLKEKDKVKKANAAIVDLDQNIVKVKKKSYDMNSELALKSHLLAEKDAQIDLFKNNSTDLQTKCENLILEVDSYKQNLDLMQEENNILRVDLDSWKQKYTSVKEISINYSAQNKQLHAEINSCNVEVVSLTEKFKNAEIDNTDANKIFVKYKQNMLNIEVELSEKKICIVNLMEENAILKNNNQLLIEDKNLNKDIIANKAKCMEMLQNDIELLAEKNLNDLKELQQQLADKSEEFKEYRKAVEQKYDVCSTYQGIIAKPVINMVEENEKLRNEVTKLERDLNIKDKKLCFAQTELTKQASEIIKNQCEIDQLNVKYAAIKSKLNKGSDNSVQKHIQSLNENLLLLNEQLVTKDNELNKLRISESNIKHREQALWELSELVNVLQQELDSKHSNILKEVEFYKRRLMEYEKRPPSVNKSMNTSFSEDNCESDPMYLKHDEGKQVDLKDLENVMTNLKKTYRDDLDALHASFKQKISEMNGSNCDVNSGQWINLMNT